MNIDIDIVSLMTPKVYMVNTNLNIVENGIQISPPFFYETWPSAHCSLFTEPSKWHRQNILQLPLSWPHSITTMLILPLWKTKA